MSADVLCLRPEADFHEVGVQPPGDLRIRFAAGPDAVPDEDLATARAVVLASVGPALERSWADRAGRVELVQFTGAGVDRAAAAFTGRPGVAVANVPAANTREVAEYVLLATGNLLRGLALADREIRAGRYREVRGRLTPAAVRSLHSATVGVVGLGQIGLAVARLFRAAGAQVGYSDPAPRDPAAADELGLSRLDLGGLLAGSDVVTLHVPLMAATRGLIGEAELRQMRPGGTAAHFGRREAPPLRADELIITTITHDHADRVRSYQLLAEEWAPTMTPPAALQDHPVCTVSPSEIGYASLRRTLPWKPGTPSAPAATSAPTGQTRWRPADLDRITEAGRRAPSASNRQHWDFIIVTEPGSAPRRCPPCGGAPATSPAQPRAIALVVPRTERRPHPPRSTTTTSGRPPTPWPSPPPTSASAPAIPRSATRMRPVRSWACLAITMSPSSSAWATRRTGRCGPSPIPTAAQAGEVIHHGRW